jgi:hypothetical protein
MPPFRFPGPVCTTREWFDDIDDGTRVRARTAPPSTVGSPVSAGSPPAQAPPAGACAFVNPQPTGTVKAPQSEFDRLRNLSGEATISTPRALDSFTWEFGAPSAAVEQDLTIGGQRILVVRPTDRDATGKNLPTTPQLAKALRAVPAAQRVYSTTVILNPWPHRDSTATATVAGESGAHKITLFPVRRAQDQTDFDNRLMHEAGHNYQEHLWNSPESVQEWQLVRRADGNFPSDYARPRVDDDFCEFNILFNTAMGTACEAGARQLYPNRWAKRMEYQSR